MKEAGQLIISAGKTVFPGLPCIIGRRSAPEWMGGFKSGNKCCQYFFLAPNRLGSEASSLIGEYLISSSSSISNNESSFFKIVNFELLSMFDSIYQPLAASRWISAVFAQTSPLFKKKFGQPI